MKNSLLTTFYSSATLIHLVKKADLTESQKDFHDSYVRKLQNSVQKIKGSREMEERFMILEEMLKEERAEGRAEGARDMLLKILEIFGEIPTPVKEKIGTTDDLNTLTDWTRLAVQSKSMKEFTDKIS